MMKQAFTHYTYVGASCIALFAFLAVFVGVVLWAFRKNAASVYRYVETFPLRDDEGGN